MQSVHPSSGLCTGEQKCYSMDSWTSKGPSNLTSHVYLTGVVAYLTFI
jgi:hypothetical protein